MHWHEVKYQPEQTKTFLGSPSIVRLSDGVLLTSHDYFGLPNCPKNHEAEESLTSIYRSEDDGVTWVNVTHIMNCYWSSLFLHRGSVYIFGTSQQYGSIVIRRSDDGGFTWTHPADNQRGLLFAAVFIEMHRITIVLRYPFWNTTGGCTKHSRMPILLLTDQVSMPVWSPHQPMLIC